MIDNMENAEPKQFDITEEEIFPQGDFMLIEPIGFTGEQKTKSGIILSEQSSSATPTIGLIKRAGESAKYKEGDMVFFRRYSLDEIEIKVSDGKKKFLFIANEDVIGQYKKQ